MEGCRIAIDIDCVFCDIAAGEGEASLVHEDRLVVAFLDVNPVNEGHTLVAPRDHLPSLAEVSGDVFAHMAVVAQSVAGALRRGAVRAEGVNLMLADGAAAFQDIFHTHLHVIPRYESDSLKVSAEWRRATRAELDATAGGLRAAME